MKARSSTAPLRGSAARQFPADRVCLSPDCETVLSRYNGDTTCSIHTGRGVPRGGRRTA